MSAVETSGVSLADLPLGDPAPYSADERRCQLGYLPWRFAVRTRFGTTVDVFHTLSGAEYAVRMLNAGMATVDRHALIGCRVVVK